MGAHVLGPGVEHSTRRVMFDCAIRGDGVVQLGSACAGTIWDHIEEARIVATLSDRYGATHG